MAADFVGGKRRNLAGVQLVVKLRVLAKRSHAKFFDPR